MISLITKLSEDYVCIVGSGAGVSMGDIAGIDINPDFLYICDMM
jgi:hypothetical protein